MKTKLFAVICGIFAVAATSSPAATNSWIDGSAKWETSADWSLGTAPSSRDSADLITNAGNNTVMIDATTTNSLGIIEITNLVVSAPLGTTNTLRVSNANPRPSTIIIDSSLSISNGGMLAITNSSFQVGDGATQFIDDGAYIHQGGQLAATGAHTFIGNTGQGQASFFSGTSAFFNDLHVGQFTGSSGTLTVSGTTTLVDAASISFGVNVGATGTAWIVNNGVLVSDAGISIGISGSGQLTLSNGQLQAGSGVAVGGTFTMAGGTAILSGLSAQSATAATGTIWITGGLLNLTNNAGINYIAALGNGQMIVSNGSVTAREFDLGLVPGSQGTLTIAGGTMTLSFLGAGVGTTDAVWITGGNFHVTTDASLGNNGVSTMVISNGIVSMAELDVPGGGVGTLTVAGGMNSFSYMDIGAAGSTGTVWITGGQTFMTNGLGQIVIGADPTDFTSGLPPGIGLMTVSNGSVVANSIILAQSQTGYTNFGRLFINGGSVTVLSEPAGGFGVGDSPGSTGIVVVTGGGQLILTNVTTTIGNNGNGSMIYSNGSGNAGETEVASGTNSQGTLMIASNGTMNVTSNLTAGAGSGSFALITVTGNSSLTITNGTLGIGNNGTATGGSGTAQMTVQHASVTAKSVLLGSSVGGHGILTVKAGGVVYIPTAPPGCAACGFSTNEGILDGGTIDAPGAPFYAGQTHPGEFDVTNGTGYFLSGYVGFDNTGTMSMVGGTVNIFSNMVGGNCGAGVIGVVGIAGGSLYVTNGGSAYLDIRDGTFSLSSGSVRADKLMMSNACAAFTFNGGTLATTASAFNNGQAFTVNSSATFNLLGGVQAFGTRLVVANHGTVSGCGTITGNVTVNAGGAIQGPCGLSLNFTGIITNNGTVSALGGTTLNFFGPVYNAGVIDARGGSVHFLGGESGPGSVVTTSVNSWQAGSGKWETGGAWSLTIPPSDMDTLDFVTNAGNKTVTIDATTTNTPDAMIVNNLIVSAPGGATNTLSLNNFGTATALTILNQFTITSGGTLIVTNAALVCNGVFDIDGGQATLLDGSTASFFDFAYVDNGKLVVAGGTNEFDLDVGEVGPATVWLTGGELEGECTFGGLGAFVQSNGVLEAVVDIEGGRMMVAGGTDIIDGLTVGMSADLTATGAVWITGGEFHVVPSPFDTASGIVIGSNDLSGTTAGLLTQSNGTSWVLSEAVEGGTLTVVGGTHVVGDDGNGTNSSYGLGPLPGLYIGTSSGTGTVWITGGQIIATNSVPIPAGAARILIGQSGTIGPCYLIQSNGMVLANSLDLSGGALEIQGGTNGLGMLDVGASGTGTVWITGGKLLVTTNYTSSSGIITIGNRGTGSLIQSNGDVETEGEFVGGALDNPGTGILTIAGGLHVVGEEGLQIGSGTGMVWIKGGQLISTNSSTLVGVTGLGEMIVSNGTVTVSSLIVTNFNDGSDINTNLFILDGGTINSRGTIISNALVFGIGDATDVAIYHLLGGVHSFENGLHVHNDGTVSGCGTIDSSATAVDPGGAVVANCGGTLTFTGILTNNGVMIAANGSVLEAFGLVVNNGTINIANGSTNFHGGYTGSGVIVTSNSPTNSWLGGNGKWETAGSWSAGSAPSSSDPADLITNAGVNTITIDATTASGFPPTLTISNLVITGATIPANTLALSNAGTNNPLHILGNLSITSAGGAIIITNSALRIDGGSFVRNDGSLILNSGLLDLGTNELRLATAPTGFIGGNLYINAGLASMGTLTLSTAGGQTAVATIGGGLLNVSGAIRVGAVGSGILTINGGSVVVTNPTQTAVLDVEIGTLTMNSSGVVVADQLSAINVIGRLNLNGGTFNSRSTAVSNAVTFFVGDATNPAVYHLLGGVHSFANGLEVRNNATLSGCGTIDGDVTVDAGGTVLADCSETLTFTGILTNNGLMEAVNGSVLEGYGLVVNNGTIDVTGGSTNFHGGFVNNGTVLGGAPFVALQTIYVANTLSNTIVKLDGSGTGTVFAATGSDTNLGLAFDGSGNLYVAVWDKSAINRYDASGQGTNFANLGFPAHPTGLAFDSSGNLYMSEYHSANILKFDSNGVGTVFGTTTNLSLERPEGLAFDRNGNLYVACWQGIDPRDTNTANGGIVKFDTNGVGTVFATSGLTGPDGIAFDSSGNLYAANFGANTIMRFDTNGVGTVFASDGLDQPDGLAFDNSGNLFVANFSSHTIVRFDTNGVRTVFAPTELFGPSFLAVGPNVSTFAIASITVTNVGGIRSIRLVWSGLPGSNEIQASSGSASASYSNNFSTVAVQILSTAGITNYVDAGGATNFPSRYYRIKAQQTQNQSQMAQVEGPVPETKAGIPSPVLNEPLQNLTTEQAGQHIGETATVCGVVVDAAYVTSLAGKPTFLDLDHSHPGEKFTVVIWGPNRTKFTFAPEMVFSGKTVCVTGPITEYRGLPEIVVEDPSQIVTK